MVTLGTVLGASGSGADGYAHLHIEIRPEREALIFYNPLYFFTLEALSAIPNGFTGYEGSSDQWRIYGYSSSEDGQTFGAFWDNTLPALWVRR